VVQFLTTVARRPILLPIQWVPGALPLQHEAEHSHHLVLRLRINGTILSIPCVPSWHAYEQLCFVYFIHIGGQNAGCHVQICLCCCYNVMSGNSFSPGWLNDSTKRVLAQ
jgi:hypothetical protein